MKKHFFIHLSVLSAIIFIFSIQSCCSSKNIPATEKKNDSALPAGKKLPGDLSISPGQFRVNALVIDEPKTNEPDQQVIYRLFIRDVLERGSSLSRIVARGDTIDAALAITSKSFETLIKKGTDVIALMEERMQVNSDRPVYFLRDIHKK